MVFLKLGISATLMWYLVENFNFADALARIESVPLLAFLLILLVFLVQLLLAALRYFMTLQVMDLQVPYSASLSSVFVGYFFSQTMISFVGGDAMRTVHTSRTGEKISQVAKAVVVDRVSGFVGQMCLIGCTLPFLLPLLPERIQRITTVAIFLAATGLLASLYWLKESARSEDSSRIASLLHGYATRILKRLRTHRAMFAFFGLSLTINLLNCFAYYLIARALNIPLTLSNAIILMPPAFFLSMLPISISGWGIREGATVTMLNIAGIVTEDALVISIFFGLSLLAISLPGGILWLTSPKRTKTADVVNAPTS
jgi:uncharacterized protein (TIRG00374 family)